MMPTQNGVSPSHHSSGGVVTRRTVHLTVAYLIGVVLLSSRPGRVVAEFPIDVPRPRGVDSAEVSELAGAITHRLREEVRRHGR